MEGAAIRGRLTWQVGTVQRIVPETSHAVTLVADIPGWSGHVPGQHVDIRLTAEDGYQAVRSYSIASPPEDRSLQVTVEQIDQGEVSPYLAREARVGDQLEFRGPIGGYFTWDIAMGGPLLLVAGGSGVVPFHAMILYRLRCGVDIPIRLLYSARSPGDVIYRDEFDRINAQHAGIEVLYTYTRRTPAGWQGFTRRVDRSMLHAVAWSPEQHPRCYVCGATPFVESVSSDLVALGHPAEAVKTERFGPTGV